MHVVVVDPSRTVLKAVSRLLAIDGHEVSTFVDGPEALAHIKSEPGVGALIGLILSRAARAIGLGFLDRLLGAVFGLARGLLIVLLLVLICGVTTLPRNDWWQNAVLAPPLGPGIAERFAFARAVTDGEVADSDACRAQFRERLGRLLGPDRVMILPTMPDVAPLLSEPEANLDAYRNAALNLLCLNGNCVL